jgi:hypothetical protein
MVCHATPAKKNACPRNSADVGRVFNVPRDTQVEYVLTNT